MKIFPSCEVKMLSECQPNQLVRILSTGVDAKFAVVCDMTVPDKRGLVSFGEAEAVFEMYEDADTISVLAYAVCWFGSLTSKDPSNRRYAKFLTRQVVSSSVTGASTSAYTAPMPIAKNLHC